MELAGEKELAAPRAKVWAALNDPEVLKGCIPGCESLEKLSETEFVATVTAKIGPIKARFSGRMQLGNVSPPESCTISGEGQGGVAGFAKGGADVSLEETGPGQTLMRYTARAAVGGKMAQLGARLVDSTAKKLAEEFFTRFGAAVADGGDELSLPRGEG
jgi:carbon monoxide dehydrogenase subunit G